MRFEVVGAMTEKGLRFDPSVGSKGGNATCPFCGTVADIHYVKDEGWEGRIGQQMMAIVCTRSGARGKVYFSVNDFPEFIPDDDIIRERIDELCERTGLTVPNEPVANQPPDCRDNSLGITVRPYGLRTWGDLFTARQMLCLLTFAAVGAGLRAFTRFARVEYANGEEVMAEKFLAEVEGVVLETLLEKMFGVAGAALAGKKDDGAEHLVATTASEQAALKKLVANWRALIDQRLAASEGTLFDLGMK